MQADWLSVAAAHEIILGAADPLPAERRPLLDCLGHVLATGIRAPLDLPRWDNSAMDGFAARAEDVHGASETSPRELRVVDDVPAGSFPARPIGRGEASRVMTGAPVPEGADSVIRLEHTDGATGIGTPRGRVQVRSDADAGRNIRLCGEDVRTGDLVLRPGIVLRAGELGVAASLGQADLRVVRRPRVAILTSGDELVDLDEFEQVLAGHRIVSSNSYSLSAQLREAGAEVKNLGIARDDPRSVRRLLEGARGCDVLITSAGVSVGEHDYMRHVLQEMGLEAAFWRVRMKPGSPVAFGRVKALGAIPWFGLPGNPVSSVVTFEVLVRPALLRMAGRSAVFHPTTQVRLSGEYPARPGLTHFLRARLDSESADRTTATLAGSQGSGILTSFVEADALVVVPKTAPGAADGDILSAILLGGSPLHKVAGYP
ncbi:molybdopterin molybdotransferase MoeA [soil metagenome]